MAVRYRAAQRRVILDAASGWYGDAPTGGEDVAAASLARAAAIVNTHLNGGGRCVVCQCAYPCCDVVAADDFLGFLGHPLRDG